MITQLLKLALLALLYSVLLTIIAAVFRHLFLL